MSSSHTDHHHHTESFAPDRIFKIGILLNLLFVFIEIYFGVFHNSLALVSDGVHNLADVFGLVIAWLGYLFSKRQTTKKFSIYAAFINTSLLIITSVWIIFEAYGRFMANEAPVALTIIFVALVGCVINFFTAKLFHKDHHHDLNMKSAYLHLMADAAISLAVVVSGIVIFYTSLFWIDPVISGVISVIIIYTTWGILRESWNMLIGRAPVSIKFADVEKSILQQEGITSITIVKIWSLSTSENALIAEIQVSSELNETNLNALKHRLYHEFKMTMVDFKQINISI